MNNEERAVEILKLYEPLAVERCDKGYIVGYSGGKDSEVLVDLFKKSGCRYHVVNYHTTIDAPETVYYVRRRIKEMDGEILYPKENFYSLLYKNGFLPTRQCRWCCKELKEYKKKEYQYAVYSFGVRKAESAKRKKNRELIEYRNNKAKLPRFHMDSDRYSKVFEPCYTNNYICINPIVDWTDAEVYDYIKKYKLELNPLYRKGFKRVGCIGCPLSSNQKKEFEMYPKYKENIIKVLDKILIKNKSNIKYDQSKFKDGEDFFNWWLSNLSVENYNKLTKN